MDVLQLVSSIIGLATSVIVLYAVLIYVRRTK